MAPGSFASTPRATSAVVEEPQTGRAGLVDQEHPVGVAVEREADVGTGVEHPRLQVHEVRRLDRVGGMVGERAVELGVHQLELDGQTGEHGGHHQAAHAVGASRPPPAAGAARWCR